MSKLLINQMKLFKVKSLPNTLELDSIYFLKKNKAVQMYITNEFGQPYLLDNNNSFQEESCTLKYFKGIKIPFEPGAYFFELFICYKGRESTKIIMNLPKDSVCSYMYKTYSNDGFLSFIYKFFSRKRIIEYKGTIQVMNSGYFEPIYNNGNMMKKSSIY